MLFIPIVEDTYSAEELASLATMSHSATTRKLHSENTHEGSADGARLLIWGIIPFVGIFLVCNIEFTPLNTPPLLDFLHGTPLFWTTIYFFVTMVFISITMHNQWFYMFPVTQARKRGELNFLIQAGQPPLLIHQIRRGLSEMDKASSRLDQFPLSTLALERSEAMKEQLPIASHLQVFFQPEALWFSAKQFCEGRNSVLNVKT